MPFVSILMSTGIGPFTRHPGSRKFGAWSRIGAKSASTSIDWNFQKLALGAPIGSEWMRTLIDTNQFNPTNNANNIQFEWLGDPTLRLQIMEPPTNLTAANEQSTVVLRWTPSNHSNTQYYVYRSTNGLDGTFTRLTSSPVYQNTYVDVTPPSGAKMYQVRAVLLMVTGSGSFTNLSQADFCSPN